VGVDSIAKSDFLMAQNSKYSGFHSLGLIQIWPD